MKHRAGALTGTTGNSIFTSVRFGSEGIRHTNVCCMTAQAEATMCDHCHIGSSEGGLFKRLIDHALSGGTYDDFCERNRLSVGSLGQRF